MVLLGNDPKKGLASRDEQIAGEKDDLRKERELVLPTNVENKEDEDEKPLIFEMKKLKESKEKEKITDSGKITVRSYSTRGS